ncbi:MAG: dihydropteroate synthase [Bacteroidetes bacterium]|nr:dihydropteroate synthase [Bacteroidota bacterium]
MGILNVTPDSFYDGGKYTDEKSILLHAEKMISDGADIIDIGACSTRPNAAEVSEEEELKRLIPVIKLVRRKFADVIISADTFRSNVAEYSVHEGADMINDISGGGFVTPSGVEGAMFETIARLQVPYVLMHIQGRPQTMQRNPHYENVMKEVMSYFKERVRKLQSLNVKQVIIDPGFGFGKATEHNYTLLKHLSVFKEFGFPILAGVSRKAMVNKVLGTKPEEALNGTTVVNTIALMNGANILRVHDVKEAKEAVKIFNYTLK